MAYDTLPLGYRQNFNYGGVREVNVSSIQQQLSELTSLIRQWAVRQQQQVKVCGICEGINHLTDYCPILQGERAKQANMTGNVPAPRRQYDPYANPYNLGWRDHPNMSYDGNWQQNFFLNP